MRWVEGQSLKVFSVPAGQIAAYARQPGRLLIYFRAGSCRSTAVGLLAKVARGCDPFDAIADIGWGLYWDRHKYPGWFINIALEIVDWQTQ